MKTEANESYAKCLKELSDIYSQNMMFPTSESESYMRFHQLVELIPNFKKDNLFIIEWTNSTAEFKSFSNYDDAYSYAYCDHLSRIIPFKKANHK